MAASPARAPSAPSAAQPDAIWSLGCLMILRGATADVEVIEALAPPDYSPPLHRHDFGTESFYVLEGRVRFVVGGEEIECGPGDVAVVPPSTPHSFLTLGEEPTRVLDLVAPGRLWRFFTECGEPAGDLRLPDAITIPPDLPEIVARHDGVVLGPPLNRP
jgi:mannose-6-phosphate isomerase-like protein (cupin superfamily)